MERLLRLIKPLSANTTYDVDRLVVRLHMSRRTVYRYIGTFGEAGFVTKNGGNHIRTPGLQPAGA